MLALSFFPNTQEQNALVAAAGAKEMSR